MENRTKTQQKIEQEMLELNEQFSAFLHTKGIAAKFKLAFNNMSESAKKQHAADVAEFEAVKAQSAEDNKEFAEFLRTKGIKAKYKLVVENIKKGCKVCTCQHCSTDCKGSGRNSGSCCPCKCYW